MGFRTNLFQLLSFVTCSCLALLCLPLLKTPCPKFDPKVLLSCCILSCLALLCLPLLKTPPPKVVTPCPPPPPTTNNSTSTTAPPPTQSTRRTTRNKNQSSPSPNAPFSWRVRNATVPIVYLPTLLNFARFMHPTIYCVCKRKVSLGTPPKRFTTTKETPPHHRCHHCHHYHHHSRESSK